MTPESVATRGFRESEEADRGRAVQQLYFTLSFPKDRACSSMYMPRTAQSKTPKHMRWQCTQERSKNNKTAT
jgi:hypothetical protein